MKTEITRAAPAKAALRPAKSSRPFHISATPVRNDYAYPGMTRAQLRELVIDQIG